MVEEMLKHFLQQECDVAVALIGFPVVTCSDDSVNLEIDYVSDRVKVDATGLLHYAIEWGARNG